MLVFSAQKLNYNSDIQVTYALPDLLCRLLDMEEVDGCALGTIAKCHNFSSLYILLGQ